MYLFNFHLFLLIFVYAGGECSELIAAITVFRHGERTPLIEIPNDPYTNRSRWPVGPGQLLNEGKLRLYELGKWFRKRYENFLNEDYSESDIYVMSTQVDRTIMSAESFLTGLYPPKNEQIWHKDINWQPIPVYTVNFLTIGKTCPRYQQLRVLNLKKEPLRHIEEETKAIRTYLTSKSGYQLERMADLTQFYITWMINKEIFHFPIPEWGETVMEKLQNLSAIEFASNCHNQEMARLSVGRFFCKFSQIFHKTIEKHRSKKTYRKLTVLSAHDKTIVDILMSLNLFNYQIPPFGAALLFELYHSDEYYVKISYKNETGAIYELQLKDCWLECPLSEFMKRIEPIIIEDWEWKRACQINSKEHLNEFFVIACALLLIFLATVCIAFYFCTNRKVTKFHTNYNNPIYSLNS